MGIPHIMCVLFVFLLFIEIPQLFLLSLLRLSIFAICSCSSFHPAIVMFRQSAWSRRSPQPNKDTDDGDGNGDRDGDDEDNGDYDDHDDIKVALTSISFLQLQLLFQHCPHDRQSWGNDSIATK